MAVYHILVSCLLVGMSNSQVFQNMGGNGVQAAGCGSSACMVEDIVPAAFDSPVSRPAESAVPTGMALLCLHQPPLG